MSNLRHTLSQFSGSEQYTRWSPMFQMVASEGVTYLAERAGAYWLLDLIASHVAFGKASGEDFLSVTLTVADTKAKAVIDDGNGNVLASQDIPYTDLEEGEYKFFVEHGVIMLPQER